MTTEFVSVKQSGTIPVIHHVPAWAWRCWDCGWLGTGHGSEKAALKEASDHAWDEHQVAICGPIDGEKQYGHPGHRWEHVKGTDAVDQCARCGDTIGK